MGNFGKKITLTTLLIAIILPSVFIMTEYFLPTKKTEAQSVSCFSGLLGGILGGAGSLVNRLTAVPVSNINIETTSGTTAGQQTASTFKDCILDFIVRQVANQLIRNFTNSIVAWIDNDFKGSPSFIDDPEKFFLNIGDTIAGDIIYGSELGFLCENFAFDLRLKLQLKYFQSGRLSENTRCTLTDVIKNVDAFMNDFNQGGWDAWLAMTQVPTNNRYGAILYVDNEILRRITEKQEAQKLDASFGKGFLTMKRCALKAEDSAGTAYDAYGLAWSESDAKGCLQYEDVTPGSVIQEQLNAALPSPLRQLEVADEINEIISAVIDYGIRQVFSSTGLFKSSRSYAYGNPYGTLAQNFAIPDGAKQAIKDDQPRNGAPPNEIISPFPGSPLLTDLSPDAEFCDAFSINFVSIGNNIKKLSNTNAGIVPISVKGQWTITLFNQMTSFCSNLALNSSLQKAVKDSADYSQYFKPTPGQGATDIRVNVALDRRDGKVKAIQTKTFLSLTAPKAIDGNRTSCNYNGYTFDTAVVMPGREGVDKNTTDFYWQVDLGQEYYIDEINLWVGQLNGSGVPLLANQQVTISKNENMSGSTAQALANPTTIQTPHVSKPTNPTLGRYVRVSAPVPLNNGVQYFYLCEVEVFNHPQPVLKFPQTSGSIQQGNTFKPLEGLAVVDLNGKETKASVAPSGQFTYTITNPSNVEIPKTSDHSYVLSVPGQYTIKYTATDDAGVPSKEEIKYLNVTPIINGSVGGTTGTFTLSAPGYGIVTAQTGENKSLNIPAGIFVSATANVTNLSGGNTCSIERQTPFSTIIETTTFPPVGGLFNFQLNSSTNIILKCPSSSNQLQISIQVNITQPTLTVSYIESSNGASGNEGESMYIHGSGFDINSGVTIRLKDWTGNIVPFGEEATAYDSTLIISTVPQVTTGTYSVSVINSGGAVESNSVTFYVNSSF